MANTPERKVREHEGGAISRREVLVGAAGAALIAGAASVVAMPLPKQLSGTQRTVATRAPIRRYMAAAAVLGDGRVLVTGGYDRPWSGGKAPPALNSVIVYNPLSDTSSVAAPMRVPRARHAAVALRDGRVAVLGGVGLNATASIEVYDPWTNSWRLAGSLAQPRYDHSAVYDGNTIYVIGGSGLTMLSGVEAVHPGGTAWF